MTQEKEEDDQLWTDGRLSCSARKATTPASPASGGACRDGSPRAKRRGSVASLAMMLPPYTMLHVYPKHLLRHEEDRYGVRKAARRSDIQTALPQGAFVH